MRCVVSWETVDLSAKAFCKIFTRFIVGFCLDFPCICLGFIVGFVIGSGGTIVACPTMSAPVPTFAPNKLTNSGAGWYYLKNERTKFTYCFRYLSYPPKKYVICSKFERKYREN